MTTLQLLRKKRRKALQRVYDLTKTIARLTKDRQDRAVKRVHHKAGCHFGHTRYLRKVSRHWDDVDCIQCWKKRRA